MYHDLLKEKFRTHYKLKLSPLVSFLQILHPGHGCPSSATFETYVVGPSSDSWKTPVATWSTSSRSSTTTATLVPATSDSTQQHKNENKTPPLTHPHLSLPFPRLPLVASDTPKNCPLVVHNMVPLNPPTTGLC